MDYVISLGGSVIVPDDVDVEYLKEFRKLILERLKKDDKFVIVCGGGKTCRRYQDSASRITNVSSKDLDWLGIAVTQSNAELVRAVFSKVAAHKVVVNTEKALGGNLQIAAGWKPGHSTDYDAVLWAQKIGAKKIVNIANIDFVYDKDPYRFDDAKPFEKLSWDELIKIVGPKWVPGRNIPFDPEAAKLAKKLGMNVKFIGKDIKNLKSFFDGDNPPGTEIS